MKKNQTEDDFENDDFDEEPLYTVYEVCGKSLQNLYLLVHRIEDPEDPDTLSSEIYQYDSQKQRLQRVFETNDWLTTLWQISSGVVYAASAEGKIYTNLSGTFKVETQIGKDRLLTFLVGDLQDNLYCTDSEGVLLCKINGKWEPFSPKPKEPLWLLQGFSSSGFYALSQKGAVVYFDGHAFLSILNRAMYRFTDLLCFQAEEFYVCGQDGRKQGVLLQGSLSKPCVEKKVPWTPTSLASYQGSIFVGAGESGIFQMKQEQVIPFADKISAYGLTVIGDALIAFGENFLSVYQAGQWKTQEFDFEYL